MFQRFLMLPFKSRVKVLDKKKEKRYYVMKPTPLRIRRTSKLLFLAALHPLSHSHPLMGKSKAEPVYLENM